VRRLRKIILLFLVLAFMIALVFLYTSTPKEGEKYSLEGRRIIVVIFEGFQPKEFYPVKGYFEENGATVSVLALHKDVGVSYDMYIYDFRMNSIIWLTAMML